MAEDNIPRFETIAALAAASALSAALSGCASLHTAQDRPRAHGESSDIVAQVERLQRSLDELPAFAPERRDAEPALTALALKIAAGMAPAFPEPLGALGPAPAEALALAEAQSAPPVLTLAAFDPGPWAVEFGQFENVDLARALWVEIASAAPDAARGLAARTAAARDGVSLRAGPLQDRAAAGELCKAFEGAGIACAPAKFVGTPIAGAGG